MNSSAISKSTLGRLPLYLKYLSGLSGMQYVSATQIASALGMGEVQVRKDLHAASGSGKPRVGYQVNDLMAQLGSLLEPQARNRAVLVGAGRLGRALLAYPGFGTFGVEIAAGFDTSPFPEYADGKPVYPMEALADYCRREQIRIGVLTVPERAAQSVCDQMVACGIRVIWSFAPVSVPAGVLLQQEDLALSLAHLCGRQTEAASSSGERAVDVCGQP